MAIAIDTSDTAATTGTSITKSYTATGSNLLMMVAVASDTGDTCTGVTYNGVSLPQIGKRNEDGTGAYVYMYGDAVSAGTADVVASFSGNSDASICIATYTGASSAIDNHTTNGSASTSSLATSITTFADNCWLVVSANGQRTISAGTGAFLRQIAAINQRALLDSNGALSPAGSHSITVNQSSANKMGVVVVSIAPYSAPAGGETVNRGLNLLGVGT